jgi:hypothetical protein
MSVSDPALEEPSNIEVAVVAPSPMLPKNADPSLISVLRKLSCDSKNTLFQNLKDLHDFSHIYHNQWKDLVVEDNIIEKSFDIVRRYEANGLQLDGYGCWLLEKVFATARHRITDCHRYPPSDILELVLRIMLEHKVYLGMKNALVEIVSTSPDLFELFCTIGLLLCFVQ